MAVPNELPLVAALDIGSSKVSAIIARPDADGRLTVPVPSQGLHLVARLDPATDPAVAAQAKTAAGVEGWLLAETYSRARPLPGFVLGFSGHSIPQLVRSAESLAQETLIALHAKRMVPKAPRL